MPKLFILKELPDGTQPGSVVDVNNDIANVLILVQAARKATVADQRPKDAAPKAEAATGQASGTGATRAYGRRDLNAQE